METPQLTSSINPKDVASFYIGQVMAGILYENQVSSQITNATLGIVLKKLESLSPEKALEILDQERDRRDDMKSELLELSKQLLTLEKEI